MCCNFRNGIERQYFRSSWNLSNSESANVVSCGMYQLLFPVRRTRLYPCLRMKLCRVKSSAKSSSRISFGRYRTNENPRNTSISEPSTSTDKKSIAVALTRSNSESSVKTGTDIGLSLFNTSELCWPLQNRVSVRPCCSGDPHAAAITRACRPDLSLSACAGTGSINRPLQPRCSKWNVWE